MTKVTSQATSLLEKVEKAFESIQDKYLPKNVEVAISNFNDIGEGIDFDFTLPNTDKHNFKPNFRLATYVLAEKDNVSFYDTLLLEVGKNLVYEVGNYELDEAYDISFCKRNRYGKRQLTFLHEDEDLIIESAQAMLVGAKFQEFDRTVDRKFGLLAPFTSNQVELIKAIYKILTKSFNLVAIDITFRGFTSTFKDGKYQQASLVFATEDRLHDFTVNIFSNQLRKYSELYAKHGFGEEEAIYFIIKTYLNIAVNKFDPSSVKLAPDANTFKELDSMTGYKNLFTSIVNKLPKRFYDLKR